MLDPCTFVVFGATGNLAQNKLLPAMYHLEEAGRTPQNMAIIGYSRHPWNQDTWQQEVQTLLSKYARGGLKQEAFEGFDDEARSILLGRTNGFVRLCREELKRS